MTTRSWRWLRVRVAGLLTRPATGYVEVGDESGKGSVLKPVRATRVQAALLDKN